MEADISRESFDSKKNYSQVVFQQGRPLLDADLNEQAAIQNHQIRELAHAIFGECCAIDPCAFEIFSLQEQLPKPVGEKGVDFGIGLGRLYAGGVFCHNLKSVRYQYQTQETVPKSVNTGWWMIYLDVRERTIT